MKRLRLIIILFVSVSCNQKSEQEIPVAPVRQGTFYLDIFEGGEVDRKSVV